MMREKSSLASGSEAKQRPSRAVVGTERREVRRGLRIRDELMWGENENFRMVFAAADNIWRRRSASGKHQQQLVVVRK